jgi:hypothetical protein
VYVVLRIAAVLATSQGVRTLDGYELAGLWFGRPHSDANLGHCAEQIRDHAPELRGALRQRYGLDLP